MSTVPQIYPLAGGSDCVAKLLLSYRFGTVPSPIGPIRRKHGRTTAMGFPGFAGCWKGRNSIWLVYALRTVNMGINGLSYVAMGMVFFGAPISYVG